MNDKNKPATIKEVAQLAGVALSTVSLFSNSNKVREGTHQKVLQAVKKLNYVPNNCCLSVNPIISALVPWFRSL